MGAKDISPEVAQRAVELVRLLVAYEAVDDIEKGLADEARAIVALLSPPVDPDLLECRELLAGFSEREGMGRSAENWRSGAWDDAGHMIRCMAALKRGRQLSQDQPS